MFFYMEQEEENERVCLKTYLIRRSKYNKSVASKIACRDETPCDCNFDHKRANYSDDH